MTAEGGGSGGWIPVILAGYVEQTEGVVRGIAWTTTWLIDRHRRGTHRGREEGDMQMKTMCQKNRCSR